MKSFLSHNLKCLLWKGLWLAGAAAFLLGWASIYMKGLVLGLDPLGWYWNALILTALSVPVKMDCSDCGTCDAGAQQ